MHSGILRRILPLVCLLATFAALAQPTPSPTGVNRGKFIAELRPYQHDFLTKELKLNKEQAREFFPVYDSMDDALQQIADETRELERRASSNPDATDTELEAASQAVFAQKEKEGKIEMEYYDKFKEILTPRQLLQLKGAERKFTQRLLRHHRKLSRNKNHNQDDQQ